MSYREGAERFYDLFGAKDDAPFYIELAHSHGDRALELGVGTARLAIQLAREGVETWGIDNSPHMLRAAEANLRREPPEVRSRVRLELADVRGFNLSERFGLVYFPSCSFDHILLKEDQVQALSNIREHVAPGGVYAFELTHIPELKPESGWFVQEKTLDEHRGVVRTGYHRTDPEKRTMTINLWYELCHDGRILERYFESGEVCIHSPEGVRALLEEAGFEVEAWYGGHDKREFTPESELMVVVARPS
ncbi:MAG: class I SAM-dependent methyltransferase [Candidatus Bathyarchaeota archaeon]|nr:MAG: class I SAM-dependent methyltransferase [Candidatus Bathyarchaeota archaeon]